MTDDAELLRRYVEEESDDAFGELVRRHIDFVYAAALRQARGNAPLAQDVVQTVFSDLARKAGALAHHEVLVGWLHTATRFAAAKAIRSESRRAAREQKFVAMNENWGPTGTDATIDWERLRLVLDDVLGELKERERAAILLRFFEKKPLAEVGAKLALTESAARSCVDRALEKMRGLLARRGLTSTAAALGVVLANQIAIAAPTGLAALVASEALAGSKAVGAAIFITSMSTPKITIAVTLVLLLAAAGMLVSQRRINAELSNEIAMLRRAIENAPRSASARNVSPRASARPARDDRPASVSLSPDVSTRDQSHPSEGAAMLEVDAWRNRGTMTPAAALESYLWAVDQVDVETTAKTIGFGERRPQVDAYFAGLSEGIRASYETPEELWAAVLTGAPHGARITGFQILSQRVEPALGDNFSVLHVRTVKEGGVVEEGDIRFESTPAGWRRSLDDRASTLIEPIFNLFQSSNKPLGVK